MKLTSPIYLTLDRKRSAGKRIPLNLNWYRNAHFQISNKAKIQYKQEMAEQIQSIVSIRWPVTIEYEYWLKVKSDIGNVHSVVEKFFQDALVCLGRIPDDNVSYITGANYRFMGFDRKNPRCEITIIEGE